MYLFVTDFEKGGELDKKEGVSDRFLIKNCSFDALTDKQFYTDELCAIFKLIINRKKRPLAEHQKEYLLSIFGYCIGLDVASQKKTIEGLARVIFNTDHDPLQNKFSDDVCNSDGEMEEDEELKEEDF